MSHPAGLFIFNHSFACFIISSASRVEDLGVRELEKGDRIKSILILINFVTRTILYFYSLVYLYDTNIHPAKHIFPGDRNFNIFAFFPSHFSVDNTIDYMQKERIK